MKEKLILYMVLLYVLLPWGREVNADDIQCLLDTTNGVSSFVVNDAVSNKLFTVLSNGKLDVGGANSTAKLAVAGMIHSTVGGIKFPDNSVQVTALANNSTWSLTGNSGLVDKTNFLGTTDGAPLDLYVGGSRALRIISSGSIFEYGVPNLIGGSSSNIINAYGSFIDWFAEGVTISGGGSSNEPNIVSDDFGVIGGGRGNVAGTDDGWLNAIFGTVGGGYSNVAAGAYSVVPGGNNNMASGNFSFAAGRNARAVHIGSLVWSDSQDGTFSSSKPDQFAIRAAGGVAINGMPITNETLHVRGQEIRIYTPNTTYGEGGRLVFGDRMRVKIEEDEDDKLNIYGFGRIALQGGNVGIHTNSPQATLHVNGNTRIDGNLIVNGNISSPGSYAWYSISPSAFKPVGTAQSSYRFGGSALTIVQALANDVVYSSSLSVGFSVFATNHIPDSMSQLAVVAPVSLPDGAKVTEIKVKMSHYTNSVFIGLYESDTGVNTPIAHIQYTAPQGAVPQTYSKILASPAQIDNQNKTYSFKINIDVTVDTAESTEVYGVFIKYEKP